MNFTAPFISFTAVSLILFLNLKLCIIPCDKNSVKSQYDWISKLYNGSYLLKFNMIYNRLLWFSDRFLHSLTKYVVQHVRRKPSYQQFVGPTVECLNSLFCITCWHWISNSVFSLGLCLYLFELAFQIF